MSIVVLMPTGPVALDGAVKVRAFSANDEPRVLEVLQAAFGQWPREIEGVAPSEFFRWKHMDGPFGPSTLLVAEGDARVIGFAAYMPWRFTANGHTLTTMRGVDFAVHPCHRRHGASLALIRTAATHASGDVAFIWSNPNRQIRPGSLRSGRRQVARLPHFVRPARPLRRTFGRARAKGPKKLQQVRIEAPTAAEILHDGAHAELLLALTNEPSDRLATSKGLGYLRWRYGDFEEYRVIRTRPGAVSGGVVIFRARRHGPFWGLHVCELLVERRDRRTTSDLLRQVRDAAPADFLSCNFFSHHHAALYGFVGYPGNTVLTARPLQPNLVPDPSRRASWALSLGDLELI